MDAETARKPCYSLEGPLEKCSGGESRETLLKRLRHCSPVHAGKKFASPAVRGRQSYVVCGAWETGDPQENPPTNGIVRHDSHMRISGSNPTKNQTSFALQEAQFATLNSSSFYATTTYKATGLPFSLDTRFRKWESCRTMPLVGVLSRGSPVSPAPSFRNSTIFTSITLIGSQDLAVKSRPNIFTSLHFIPAVGEWVKIFGWLETARSRDPMRVIEETMEQRRDQKAGRKRRSPRKLADQQRRSGTIPARENPGSIPPGIELVSPWWEMSMQQEHCTPVERIALSGDATLDERGSVALIANALLTLKRDIKLQIGSRLVEVILARLRSESVGALGASETCAINSLAASTRKALNWRAAFPHVGRFVLELCTPLYHGGHLGDYVAVRPRSRSEGGIRATVTRTPSASSLLRARRAVLEPADQPNLLPTQSAKYSGLYIGPLRRVSKSAQFTAKSRVLHGRTRDLERWLRRIYSLDPKSLERCLADLSPANYAARPQCNWKFPTPAAHGSCRPSPSSIIHLPLFVAFLDALEPLREFNDSVFLSTRLDDAFHPCLVSISSNRPFPKISLDRRMDKVMRPMATSSVYTAFDASWRTVAQSSSSTVTADSQRAVDIGKPNAVDNQTQDPFPETRAANQRLLALVSKEPQCHFISVYRLFTVKTKEYVTLSEDYETPAGGRGRWIGRRRDAARRFVYCTADNIDFLKDTPDGRVTLRGTVMVVYQEEKSDEQTPIEISGSSPLRSLSKIPESLTKVIPGTDEALEQENKKMKVIGGMINITQRKQALTQFFLTSPELSRLSAEAKEMLGITNRKRSKQYHLTASQEKRQKEDAQQMYNYIMSSTNFVVYDEKDLINISLKLVFDENIQKDMSGMTVKGQVIEEQQHFYPMNSTHFPSDGTNDRSPLPDQIKLPLDSYSAAILDVMAQFQALHKPAHVRLRNTSTYVAKGADGRGRCALLLAVNFGRGRKFPEQNILRLRYYRWGRGGVVFRLLSSNLSEPGSILAGVAPGISHAGTVPGNAAGRGEFSAGISRFPRPLHSGAASCSSDFILIGSQDLETKTTALLHFWGLLTARTCETIRVIDVSMEQCRNERQRKREIPGKNHRPTPSSDTMIA
ncbi:hypothetical protein PR048_008031 [Dryococelus australis]|uniref:Uncharacterized protein n=1 Tax=Dryococelus australis TaxID=614101 RepID=A0ABQ9HVY6_9NEOP|nr:hypothetical protein PR048_008031 [Dryococelus australis]